MTREEAIKKLEDTLEYRDRYCNEHDIERNALTDALDMAIAALREQEERSEGCDWCGFFFDHSGKFHFCPQCGRRLEEV